MAKRGFILIDAVPFAMKYDSKIRREIAYRDLFEN